MAVRLTQMPEVNSIYFITFTCYQWLPLIEIVNGYDAFYKWFEWMYNCQIFVTAYVIMPNHVHLLLNFEQKTKSLNSTIANGKRFLAYEIVKRLEQKNEQNVLAILRDNLVAYQIKRGQKHQVFEKSFDAKMCESVDFIYQKIDYIHENPVKGKWQLAPDAILYPHSSASFYEGEQNKFCRLRHISEFI